MEESRQFSSGIFKFGKWGTIDGERLLITIICFPESIVILSNIPSMSQMNEMVDNTAMNKKNNERQRIASSKESMN